MLLACAAISAHAQTPLVNAPSPNLSSVTNQFYGSVTTAKATPETLQLSLDDAIARGLQTNLGLTLQQQTERSEHGEMLSVFSSLVPNLSMSANTAAEEIDLQALGFKPSLLAKFHIPPGEFPLIIKVNTTQAQVKMTQQLFSMPAIELYKAAKAVIQEGHLDVLNARGGVVITVGTQYLHTLADAAQIDNANALLRADQELLRQATESHKAGVSTNLDELRARVQYQTQQQALINAENTFAKDKMALNRMIGLPPEQPIELTDTVPYAELAAIPLEETKQIAYARRKDYLSMQQQVRAAELERKAAKYERLPTLNIKANYGVLGVTEGLYHGVFNAEASLNFPIFKEASLRGDREVADASLNDLHARLADLQVTIESQLRSSRLDVNAAAELVKVARSNVDLATEELQQSADRFQAGVSDNLPVVQAQATLADAQAQLVSALYQFNQAKLTLARNTGVVETQYKIYLGR